MGDWIAFILGIIIGWPMWSLLKAIFFNNAIVAAKTYYFWMLACYAIGWTIGSSIVDWIVGIFNCLII